jgi:hypothetical protein
LGFSTRPFLTKKGSKPKKNAAANDRNMTCIQSYLYPTAKKFTPLESPAIYGGDNINKPSIRYRKGGVKAPTR